MCTVQNQHRNLQHISDFNLKKVLLEKVSFEEETAECCKAYLAKYFLCRHEIPLAYCGILAV